MVINFYLNVIYLLQFNLKTIKLFFNGIISSIIFEGSNHSIIPKGVFLPSFLFFILCYLYIYLTFGRNGAKDFMNNSY